MLQIRPFSPKFDRYPCAARFPCTMLFTAFFLCLFAVRSALAGQLEEAAKNINTFVFDSGSGSDTSTSFNNFDSEFYNNGILTLTYRGSSDASARFRQRSGNCLSVGAYTHLELLMRANLDVRSFDVGLIPFIGFSCTSWSTVTTFSPCSNFNGKL